MPLNEAADDLNRSYWIAKADDYMQQNYGFQLFDLTDEQMDAVIAQYEHGATPEDAVKNIHETDEVQI